MTGEPPCCGAGFRFLFHREAGLRGGGGGLGVLAQKAKAVRCATRSIISCAAGRWSGGMQTGREFSALYAARSIFCCAVGRGPAGVLLQKAEAVRCAARFAALSRDPRGAAGTFLSRRIAAGKEKYPEKKPGTLIFLSGTAFKFTKAAVRKPEPRLFFPHLKRRRERKAAQKKGLGSRRSGGNTVLMNFAFGERGRPRARRRAARRAQRAAKPSRCEFCNSPQRPFRFRNTGPPLGATQQGTSLRNANPPPKISSTQTKESFFPLSPTDTARSAADAHVPETLQPDGSAGHKSP